MKQVCLEWKSDQREESERGVRISRYLKEHGLQMGRDYTWRLDAGKREIVFMFNDESQAWTSMLTMMEL